MGDENHLVDPEHLLAALRRKLGREDVVLMDYNVRRATANVLGITSVILRALVEYTCTEGGGVAAAASGDGNSTTVDSLVVKRLPLCRAQLDLVNTCSSFEREIEYLTECVPILEANAKSNLAIVECYFGRERVLVMEDMCAAGFHSLLASIGELQNDLITVAHAAAVVAALAEMHAASFGVDWLAEFPKFLPHDPLFDDAGGDIFKSQLGSAIDGLMLLLSDDLKRQFSDAVGWLKNSDVYKQVRDLVKSPDFNVLNHGDPWANNILFRRDGEKFHLKFVDFQLGRVAPGWCDLLYFLYTSTNSLFRQNNESAR